MGRYFRPERLEEYRARHREVWPEMLRALKQTGWHNYSLFLRPYGLLVGYLETPDFEKARAVLAFGGVIRDLYRRHGWASTLEMVGAMFAPAIALIPLLWLGVIGGDALLMLEHLAMFVLMFPIMLRRRAEYGGAAHG